MYKKLAQKNKTRDPEAYASAYGALVSNEFRKKYSQSDVEAIVNNYLAEPSNPEYLKEFIEMQAYRKACKDKAKTTLGEK